MDFASDALANGRRIKVLTIVDDFSKEAVDLVADFGISGQYVTRILNQALVSVVTPRRTEPEIAVFETARMTIALIT